MTLAARRRAALAALFAVGLHCAAPGRARAETPAAVDAPAPTPWESLKPEEQKVLARHGERWNSLPAEQQQRLLRGTRRWLAMTPEQRAAGAGALRSAGRNSRPSSGAARASAGIASASCRPKQQARVREDYHRLQEAHSRTAPAPARALAERHAGRAAADAGAPPAADGTPGASAAVANYWAVDGAGVGGIFLVFVPGLAQLIT